MKEKKNLSEREMGSTEKWDANISEGPKMLYNDDGSQGAISLGNAVSLASRRFWIFYSSLFCLVKPTVTTWEKWVLKPQWQCVGQYYPGGMLKPNLSLYPTLRPASHPPISPTTPMLLSSEDCGFSKNCNLDDTMGLVVTTFVSNDVSENQLLLSPGEGGEEQVVHASSDFLNY